MDSTSRAGLDIEFLRLIFKDGGQVELSPSYRKSLLTCFYKYCKQWWRRERMFQATTVEGHWVFIRMSQVMCIIIFYEDEETEE